MAVLVIEQNIGVATAISPQRRDHGQRPHQPHHRLGTARRRPRAAAAPARRRPSRRARARSSMCPRPAPEPRARRRPRSRRADPHLHLQPDACRRGGRSRCRSARIEAAARHALDAGARGLDETARRKRRAGSRRRPPDRPSCWSPARSTPRAQELRFIRDIIAESGPARGWSTSRPAASIPAGDVSAAGDRR